MLQTHYTVCAAELFVFFTPLLMHFRWQYSISGYVCPQGTVARDFWPLVFSWIDSVWTPELLTIFLTSNSDSNLWNYPSINVVPRGLLNRRNLFVDVSDSGEMYYSIKKYNLYTYLCSSAAPKRTDYSAIPGGNPPGKWQSLFLWPDSNSDCCITCRCATIEPF
jgi:hypothetical protein